MAATDYINTLDADNHNHPDQPARLVIGFDDQHHDQVDIQGKHATVTSHYRARWEPTTGTGYVSDALPWTATAERQSDGWRLTSITIPPWCGTLHHDGNRHRLRQMLTTATYGANRSTRPVKRRPSTVDNCTDHAYGQPV